MASKACVGEKVKLNGDFIKSSKIVKKNDVIAIKVVPIWKIFKIIDLPKTRVGAKLVGDFSKEITSNEDLELLNQYELINSQNRSIGIIKLCFIFAALLAYGVTGNTSDFGSEESRFEP